MFTTPKQRIIFALVFFTIIMPIPVLAAEASKAKRSFVDAIAFVESGDRPLAAHWDVNAMRLGFFQISKAVHQDAAEFDKTLTGTWEQCANDRVYAKRVMMAYFGRYCPKAIKANDYETMARIWNGGPKGASKSATLPYWNKVKAAMGI